MEELIEKDALSEEIESLTVHVTGLRAGKGVLSKFMDEYRNSVLRIIDEQPTTTEAEIRASAITAISKAMKEYYPSCKGAYVDFDVYFHAVMAKVAEQLKEE